MTQHPLCDLATEFQEDVRAISRKFEEGVRESSRGFEMHVADYFDMLHSASPRDHQVAAAPTRNNASTCIAASSVPMGGGNAGCRGSGGRGSGGKRRSGGRGSGGGGRGQNSGEDALPACIEESPMKRLKVGSEFSGDVARNTAVRIAVGSPARPADPSLLSTAARSSPMSSSPSPMKSALKVVGNIASTIVDKVRGTPPSMPAATLASKADVGRLFSASPRPGGLLDAMRARGTLRGDNVPVGSSPILGGSPAHLVASATPAASLQPQRLAATAALPPKMPILPPSTGKSVSITTAKKFRRSSMARLKAASVQEKKAMTSNDAVQDAPLDQAATVTSAAVQSVAKSQLRPKGKKKQRPPVPSFPENSQRPSTPPPIEPWQLLRKVQLNPKKEEDNYEISDREEDSDDGMGEIVEADRSHKHVPQWARNYLDALAKQEHMDPESIFGSKVPLCDLEIIFPDSFYMKHTQERPKRKRGSSAVWSNDILTRNSIGAYKRKMGQKIAWNARHSLAAALCGTKNSSKSACSAAPAPAAAAQ